MLFMKRLVAKMLKLFGLGVYRISKRPDHTLLGFKKISIRTIIDVGANTGQFAKYISEFFPEAKIYSFEPLPDPFKKLKRWADSQNGRVNAFNLALGDKEGVIKMFNHLNHDTSSSILKTTNICEDLYPFTKRQTTQTIKMTTLDKAIAGISKSLSSDILIKLDVQGFEDRVIGGGIETFRKARVCISEISLDQLYDNQATFRKIFLLLDELGYHYAGNLSQVYGDDGHVIFIDTIFVK